MEFMTGFGLASAAGLNAYIPLLSMGLLGRFTNVIHLPPGWSWLENGWVIGIVAVLLLVEIVADKVPALDSVNDTIQTFVRPTSGGIVFGSGTAAQTAAVADPAEFARTGQWVPIVIGVVTALVVHRGPARRQRRHRRRGRAGAEHTGGLHERGPHVHRDPHPRPRRRGANRAGVGCGVAPSPTAAQTLVVQGCFAGARHDTGLAPVLAVTLFAGSISPSPGAVPQQPRGRVGH